METAAAIEGAAVSRARSGISRAEERRIALSLSPPIAWPTLALAVLLPATFLAIVAFGLTGRLPLWACTPLLGLVSYAHYTLVHESIHSNAASAKSGFGWLNPVVGWIGALGLGIGYPALQKTHLLHHSHTNTESDPDLFVKGSLLRLFGVWLKNVPLSLMPMVLLKYVAPGPYDQLKGVFTTRDVLLNSAVTVGTLVLLGVAVATGHVIDWLCLWFLPTRLGVLVLNIFFQWLPHHPFDRTDRYGNTRVSLWAGGTIFTLQQNLHLMHHLWPSVPFYNYGRLFTALRPVLIEEGSRIEGFGVAPWVRTAEQGSGR